MFEGEMIKRNSQFCKGKQVGVHGRMFGADLMEELDSVCAVFAAEVVDTPWIVTKVMNIEFVAPIMPNQIYCTYVSVVHIGNKSIKLYAEIRKYSVQTQKETVCVKANTVFVRINEDGDAVRISDNARNKFNKKLTEELVNGK